MPKGVTVDDLMGSLWEATPFDGKQYNYDNVDGDWYNTSTTTFIFDNQGTVRNGGQFHCAPPLTEDVFFNKGAPGLSADDIQVGPNCLGVAFAYILNTLCNKNVNYGDIMLQYCQNYNVPLGKFIGFSFDKGEYNKFFNNYFCRGNQNSIIDAIDSGQPCLGFLGPNNDEGHQIVIIGYNSSENSYFYIDPELEGIRSDLTISSFQDHYFYSVSKCR